MMTGLRRHSGPVAAVLTGAILLAGCADQKASMTAQGAGVGAVAGGLLGAILGGERGALIGAAAGAAVGGIGGYALGSQQEKFASAEQELAVRTERARAIADSQRQAANQARVAAAQYERSLAPLRQQVANGRAVTNQQRQSLNAAIGERDRMQAQVNAGNAALGEIQASVNSLRQKGQNTSALEAEGRDLQANTQRLQGALDRMNVALGNIEA